VSANRPGSAAINETTNKSSFIVEQSKMVKILSKDEKSRSGVKKNMKSDSINETSRIANSK
jgi:hypothetical protein